MDDMSVYALTGAYIGVYTVVTLVWWLLGVIAKWKLFTKAGEAGWKSIIPIYSDYIMYKLSWETMMFWIVLILAIVASIISGILGDTVVSIVIQAVITVVMLVISIIEQYKISLSYGHGVGFCIGLILLNPIFMIILGLGSSEYKGNMS